MASTVKASGPKPAPSPAAEPAPSTKTAKSQAPGKKAQAAAFDQERSRSTFEAPAAKAPVDLSGQGGSSPAAAKATVAKPPTVKEAKANVSAAEAKAVESVQSAQDQAAADIAAAQAQHAADLATAEAKASADLAALGKDEKADLRADVRSANDGLEQTVTDAGRSAKGAARDAQGALDTAKNTAASGLTGALDAASTGMKEAATTAADQMTANRRGAARAVNAAQTEALSQVSSAQGNADAASLKAAGSQAMDATTAAGAAAAQTLGEASSAAVTDLRAAGASAVETLSSAQQDVAGQLQVSNKATLDGLAAAGDAAIQSVTAGRTEARAEIADAQRQAISGVEGGAAQIEADLAAARAEADAAFQASVDQAGASLSAAQDQARADVAAAASAARESLAGTAGARRKLRAAERGALDTLKAAGATAAEGVDAAGAAAAEAASEAGEAFQGTADTLAAAAGAKAERVKGQVMEIASDGRADARRTMNAGVEKLTIRTDANEAVLTAAGRQDGRNLQAIADANVRTAQIAADAGVRTAQSQMAQDLRAAEIRTGAAVGTVRVQANAAADQAAAGGARGQATPEQIALKAEQDLNAVDLRMTNDLAQSRLAGNFERKQIQLDAGLQRELSTAELDSTLAANTIRSQAAIHTTQTEANAALRGLKPGADTAAIQQQSGDVVAAIQSSAADSLRQVRTGLRFETTRANLQGTADLRVAREQFQKAAGVQEVTGAAALAANRIEGGAALETAAVQARMDEALAKPAANAAEIRADARADIRAIEASADQRLDRRAEATSAQVAEIRKDSGATVDRIQQGAAEEIFKEKFDAGLLTETETSALRAEESARIAKVVSGISDDMQEQSSVSGSSAARYAEQLSALSGEVLTPDLKRSVDRLHGTLHGQNHISNENQATIDSTIQGMERRIGRDLSGDNLVAGFSKEYLTQAVTVGQATQYEGWTDGARKFAEAVAGADNRPGDAAAMSAAATSAQPIDAHGKHFSEVPEAATDGMLMGGDGRLYDPSTPLDQVPAFEPGKFGGVAGKLPDGVMTTGVLNDAASQFASLQAYANASGKSVVGMRNASGGFFSDIAEAVKETLGFDSKPTEALTEVIGNQVKAGNPLGAIGHSQGALQNAEAIENVRDGLIASGMTPQQAERALSELSVQTMGGAALNHVDGPQYEHHKHALDPVAALFGVGNPLAHLGKNATVTTHTIRAPNPHALETHLDAIYGRPGPGGPTSLRAQAEAFANSLGALSEVRQTGSLSGNHDLATGLTAALSMGSRDNRDAALDDLAAAGVDVSIARDLSARMERDDFTFGELMDASPFDHVDPAPATGGNDSSGGSTDPFSDPAIGSVTQAEADSMSGPEVFNGSFNGGNGSSGGSSNSGGSFSDGQGGTTSVGPGGGLGHI